MKTLVVPEGGELPPEEELQAMEAADAAAQAAEEAAKAEQQQEVVEYLEEEDEETADAGGEEAAPTPAEAAEAAPFDIAGEARRCGAAGGRDWGRGEGRAGAPPEAAESRTREQLEFSTGSPEACGAPRELPAASGENALPSCGRRGV